MGGTYHLSNFKNRESQYPSRRKLLPVAGQTNVYDVERDEGTVTVEGSPWGANTMNEFDAKIANMFPVSIANGGTGATSKTSAMNNLMTQSTFTPDIYSSTLPTRHLNYNGNGGTRLGVYVKCGKLVYVNIYIRNCLGYEISPDYLAIGPLPFTASSKVSNSALSIAEFSLISTQHPEYLNETYTARTLAGSKFVYMYYKCGSNAVPVSYFGTGSTSTSSRLDAIISGIYYSES